MKTVSVLAPPVTRWYVKHPEYGMMQTDYTFQNQGDSVGVVVGIDALRILENNPEVMLIRHGEGARHGVIGPLHFLDGTGAVH